MNGTQVLVRCDDVGHTFGSGPSAIVAVHGATCRVREHDRIALVGPSGSGKSTLLHLMAGLEEPTSGRLSWPALSPDYYDRAESIGVIFQSPSLIPDLDVFENVELPLLLAPSPDSDRSSERTAVLIKDALANVGVDDLITRLPEELSGGQAQRVAVARVLAQAPRLILADEPTGQLDSRTAHHVIDVLLSAARRLDAALVVATHDPSVADRLDTRWSMHEGRLAPQGNTR